MAEALFVDDRMMPIYEHLERVIQHLQYLHESPGPLSYKEVGNIQNELHRIDEKYSQGAFRRADGSVLEGQAVLSELLEEAHELVHAIVCSLPEHDEDIDQHYRPIRRKLSKILGVLDSLKHQKEKRITSRDVGKLQNDLHKIDDHFKKIEFTAIGEVPEGQAQISQMIEDAYDSIRQLVLVVPEEVSELREPAELSEELVAMKMKLQQIINTLKRLQERPSTLNPKVVDAVDNELADLDHRVDKIPSRDRKAELSDLLCEAHDLTLGLEMELAKD